MFRDPSTVVIGRSCRYFTGISPLDPSPFAAAHTLDFPPARPAVSRSMRLPDLLASRRGRLAAFFLLYLTEGLPSGFTGTAVATQMRRQGLGPAAIGSFIGILYIPWAIKWAFGPFVDVLSSDRWGRRRMWILLTQTMMVVTILAAMAVGFQNNLWLLSAVILIHNVFISTH